MAQRIAEINTRLPFADPIALCRSDPFGYEFERDHTEALIENDWRDWQALGGRMTLRAYRFDGNYADYPVILGAIQPRCCDPDPCYIEFP